MNKLHLILMCAIVTLFDRHINALETGAPQGTCISMAPSVGKHGPPQTGKAPYVIQVDRSYYTQNSTVKVYIKACGDATIGGFLIQAREKDKTKPLGSFSMIPSDTKYLDCKGMGAETEKSAVTHSKVLSSKMLSFEWKPYYDKNTGLMTENIYLVATIAETRPTYWLQVKSIELEKMTPGKQFPAPDNPKCPDGSMTTEATPDENGKDGDDKNAGDDKDAGSSAVVNTALLVLAISVKLFL